MRRDRALTAPLFPGVQQSRDVPLLLGRERNVGEEPAYLGGIVVLDGGLEMLADGRRLLQLTPEPAKKADLSRARHSGNRTTSATSSTSTDPPTARTASTATAAPRSRSSSPSRTGPDE